MGPRNGTLKRERSHLTDNCEFSQYDVRFMRRLKRRSVVGEMMEQKYSANAKGKNAGNNGHVLEEEVDEDYGFVLDEDVFHVDAVSDDNVVASSGIDVDTGHDSDNDGYGDAQYKMFLENSREDEKSYMLKVFVDNKFFCVKYEGLQERLHDLVNSEIQCECDEDYQLFLNSSRLDSDGLIFIPERAAIARKYGYSEPEGTISKIKQTLQFPFEVTELPKVGQASEDHRVAKNKLSSEGLSDVDEDWKLYLNSEIMKNSEEKPSAIGQSSQIFSKERSYARQASDDHLVAKNKLPSEVLSDIEDEDWKIYFNSEIGKSSKEKPLVVRQSLQVSDEATEPSNAGQASDDYCVAKNKFPCDVVDEDWLIYLNSEARKNSGETLSGVKMNLQVNNDATELPNARHDLAGSNEAKLKCNYKELCNVIDGNYQLFLRSVCTNGDDLIYMHENGVTVVFGEECDRSSADSEPIISDPSKHYKESPSISSKNYQSACLVDERNKEDTLFRKELMQELERPYSQKELDELLQLALHERPKEQHREMRYGVTKDRPKRGCDNKTSYLKMHKDLKTAIDQVQESQKVLFLLRGFFYWLKHVPQGGAFQPWLDTSCLKILQKL